MEYTSKKSTEVSKFFFGCSRKSMEIFDILDHGTVSQSSQEQVKIQCAILMALSLKVKRNAQHQNWH
jgi:hypothetical protein